MSAMHRALALYEAIGVSSAVMRDAARRGDWDALIEAEDHCRRLVGALRALPAEPQLDAQARARRAEILRTVLANDAEVRELAAPRLAELARLLRLCANERRLHEAYRAA